MIRIFLITIIIAGCVPVVEEAPDGVSACEQYGCEHDAVTQGGIPFRDDIGGYDNYMDVIDDAYEETASCMGLWAEPDLIVVVSSDVPAGANAMTANMQDDTSVVLIRPVFWYYKALQHEFVHHILNRVTGDPDGEHNSQFFEECSGLGR